MKLRLYFRGCLHHGPWSRPNSFVKHVIGCFSFFLSQGRLWWRTPAPLTIHMLPLRQKNHLLKKSQHNAHNFILFFQQKYYNLQHGPLMFNIISWKIVCTHSIIPNVSLMIMSYIVCPTILTTTSVVETLIFPKSTVLTKSTLQNNFRPQIRKFGEVARQEIDTRITLKLNCFWGWGWVVDLTRYFMSDESINLWVPNFNKFAEVGVLEFGYYNGRST